MHFNNNDTEETVISAKMLKIDAEYSTNLIRHSLQKLRKNGTLPTDISQSAGGIPSQPCLHKYPKHSERKSHARSFVSDGLTNTNGPNIHKNVMFCFACRHFAPPAYGNVDNVSIKI